MQPFYHNLLIPENSTRRSKFSLSCCFIKGIRHIIYIILTSINYASSNYFRKVNLFSISVSCQLSVGGSSTIVIASDKKRWVSWIWGNL